VSGRRSSVPLVVVRYVASIVVLVVVWDAVVRIGDLKAYVLPPPWDVLKTLFNEAGVFWAAMVFTVKNMLLGAALGIGLGLIAGALIAIARPVRWIAEPYLLIFQSFPREALIPLFIVWMGFGAGPKIVNSALLSFFPMAVVTLNGLSDTRRDYLELMDSWGATKLQQFAYCRLPAVVPTLIGGLKIAMPLALIGAVLGEFMGGSEGLGYTIVSSGSAFRVDRIFAAILCLGGVGISGFALINGIQALFLQRFNQE
jgi:NitT/TauT family transport system permease protein